MLKALLFDLDGTLVCSEEIHYQLWRDIVADYGVALAEDEYRRYYAGVPTQQNAADLIARHGLSQSVALLAGRKRSATEAYMARQAFPAMPYADSTLRQLRAAGWLMAIVTGSGRDCVTRTLAEHNWGDLFDTTVSCDDVVNSKPAPDSYQLALANLGLQPQQAIAIEDTCHGLQAAWGASVKCLVVPTEMTAEQDFAKAYQRLAHLGELPAWLAHNGGAKPQ